MMTFWGPAMPPPPRGAFHDVNVLLPSWRLTTEPATGQGTPHVARSAWTQVGGRPVGPLRFAQGPTPRMTHLRSNLRPHNNKGATCVEPVDRSQAPTLLTGHSLRSLLVRPAGCNSSPAKARKVSPARSALRALVHSHERWYTARWAAGLTPTHVLTSATRRHEDIARKFIGKYAGRPRGHRQGRRAEGS